MSARVAAAVVLGLVAAGAACSSPDPDARVRPALPDRAAFNVVAPVLVKRCGTLDCHGSDFRNMRLYGEFGRRLDPGMLPDAPGMTTPEIEADYQAVVGLEPELISSVVAGADPGTLTFVRKGRGDEEHKGGRLIEPQSEADRCVLGWLRGRPEPNACDTARRQD